MKPASVTRLALSLFALAVGTARLGEAREVDSYELRRSRACQLTDTHAPEAEAALLKLLKERPDDGGVLFALGRVAMRAASSLEPGAPAAGGKPADARLFYPRPRPRLQRPVD